MVLVGLGIGLSYPRLPEILNYLKLGASPQLVAEQVYKSCSNPTTPEISTETCYSKEFSKVAYQYGSTFSFEALTSLQKKDSSSLGCHLIAHGIGLGTYKRNPSSWQTEINNIDPSCSYGAIHGILELHVDSLPDGLTKEIVPSLCGSNPRADCNHIIGHLILVETKGDIKKALDYCQVFKDEIQLFHCETGVFMEDQTAVNLVAHGLADESWLNWSVRMPELERVCREQTGKNEIVACWMEITHAAAIKFGNNPADVFTFCDGAQTAEASEKCKSHAIGILAASQNFDLEKGRAMCQLPQPNDSNFEGNCYVHLVASTVISAPQLVPGVVKFCSSIRSELQPSCFTQVGANLKQFSNHDQVVNYCTEAPVTQQAICRGE